MSVPLTAPRQVRLKTCRIYSPGMEVRATSSSAAQSVYTGVDVADWVTRIEIYESIFDNTLSGNIYFTDQIAFPEYLPLVGTEFLIIDFEVAVSDDPTQQISFQNVFRVVKLAEQVFKINNIREYRLGLVSPVFVESLSKRISRTFTDQTCLQAVKGILNDDLGVSSLVEEEKTPELLTVTIPNYTPLQAINYFVIRALTTSTPHESNFLFFQTLDGYHFVSVRKMIEDGLSNSKLVTFNVNDAIANSPHPSISQLYNSIQRLYQEQSFDVLPDITDGLLRTRVLHLDFLGRRWAEEDSRYSETFLNTTHLEGDNSFPLYPINFDLTVNNNVKLFVVPSNVWSSKSAYLASVQEVLSPQSLHETIVLRNRQLKELMHIRSLVELPGRTDIRAGTVVNVLYPTTKVVEGDTSAPQAPTLDTGSPFYSGRHLVTSVAHVLVKSTTASFDYQMQIEVSRDCLSAPLLPFPSDL